MSTDLPHHCHIGIEDVTVLVAEQVDGDHAAALTERVEIREHTFYVWGRPCDVPRLRVKELPARPGLLRLATRVARWVPGEIGMPWQAGGSRLAGGTELQ